jgi:hypothetical protein
VETVNVYFPCPPVYLGVRFEEGDVGFHVGGVMQWGF